MHKPTKNKTVTKASSGAQQGAKSAFSLATILLSSLIAIPALTPAHGSLLGAQVAAEGEITPEILPIVKCSETKPDLGFCYEKDDYKIKPVYVSAEELGKVIELEDDPANPGKKRIKSSANKAFTVIPGGSLELATVQAAANNFYAVNQEVAIAEGGKVADYTANPKTTMASSGNTNDAKSVRTKLISKANSETEASLQWYNYSFPFVVGSSKTADSGLRIRVVGGSGSTPVQFTNIYKLATGDPVKDQLKPLSNNADEAKATAKEQINALRNLSADAKAAAVQKVEAAADAAAVKAARDEAVAADLAIKKDQLKAEINTLPLLDDVEKQNAQKQLQMAENIVDAQGAYTKALQLVKGKAQAELDALDTLTDDQYSTAQVAIASANDAATVLAKLSEAKELAKGKAPKPDNSPGAGAGNTGGDDEDFASNQDFQTIGSARKSAKARVDRLQHLSEKSKETFKLNIDTKSPTIKDVIDTLKRAIAKDKENAAAANTAPSADLAPAKEKAKADLAALPLITDEEKQEFKAKIEAAGTPEDARNGYLDALQKVREKGVKLSQDLPGLKKADKEYYYNEIDFAYTADEVLSLLEHAKLRGAFNNAEALKETATYKNDAAKRAKFDGALADTQEKLGSVKTDADPRVVPAKETFTKAVSDLQAAVTALGAKEPVSSAPEEETAEELKAAKDKAYAELEKLQLPDDRKKVFKTNIQTSNKIADVNATLERAKKAAQESAGNAGNGGSTGNAGSTDGAGNAGNDSNAGNSSNPASGGSSASAQDAGKTIYAVGHVDSPHIVWEGDNFALKGKFDSLLPVENTVNHLQLAFDRNKKQAFMLEIPENAPELSFLGKTGDAWYHGDAVNLPGLPNIWAGFGADAGVPIDQFRDGLFTLDLVSVKGPGRVELFNWIPDGAEGATGEIDRFFSSRDAHWRSYPMTAGTHTHNRTVFERPGRYELTYRATARTKDGRLIASEPRVLEWQVGGSFPKQKLPAVAKPAGVKPGFSIDKSVVRDVPDKSVKKHLRTLSVATDKAQAGTVQFTVNGFHLAEAELKDGYAAYTDMLGSGTAKYQAIVRDAAGKVVWTSAALDYSATGDAANTNEAGEAVAKTPSDSLVYSPAEQTIDADAGFTVSLEPGTHAGAGTLRVKFDKPGVHGIMHFLAYESKNDKRVPIWNQFYSVAGTQDFTIEHPGIYIEDAYIVAQFVPHGSAKNLQSSKQVEVADGYALDKKYQAQGVAKVVPGSADQGATQPTQPGANQPTQPVKPAPADPTQPVANPWGDRLLIKDGHLDIAAKMDADALQITLIDDSNTEGQGRKERALNTVAIAVNDAARLSERQKNAISRDAYKHILNFDSNDNWLLPLSQKKGLPWPGYSTEHVAAGKVAGDFTLELTKVSGPGKVTLYQTDGFGGNPEVLLSGDKRSLTVPQNTHAHAAWAFTAPGVYELTLQYRAQGAAGNQLQTEEQTLMFVVGDKALAGDASSNSNGNVTVPTPVPNPGIALPPGGIINDVSRGDQPAPTQTAPAPYTGDLKHKGEGVTAPEKPTVEVPATEQPAPAPQGGKSEDAKGQKLPDTGTDASALLAAAAILTAAGAATLVARRRKA